MKTESSIKEGEIACIRGRGFQGQLRHSGNSVILNITDFTKKLIYEVELTDETLRKEFKFLIFRQIDDLFIELVTNKHLEISDERSLLIPIEVDYNGRGFPLRAEIPLVQAKFETDQKRIDSLYKLIARMHDYYGAVDHEKVQIYKKQWTKKTQDIRGIKEGKLLQGEGFGEGRSSFQQIVFIGDIQNTSYKNLDVKDNIVSVKTGNQFLLYNHNETLPTSGLFYFKFKPTKVTNKNFYAGLCGKNIINDHAEDILKSPYFMALKFENKGSYMTGTTVIAGVGDIKLTENSVIKVEINMHIKNVTWYLDNEPIYIARIPKELMDVFIYPFIGLYKTGDKVEFINY